MSIRQGDKVRIGNDTGTVMNISHSGQFDKDTTALVQSDTTGNVDRHHVASLHPL